MSSTSVLIVEDEFIVARDIADSLTGLGFSVAAVVGSGEEAVQIAGEKHPGVVLMDIQLREQMDGIEAARQIGDRFAIPVVFLTSFASEEVMKRIKETPSQGFLVKPYDERELQAVIDLALFKSNMERRLEEEKGRYQELVENTNSIILKLDPAGKIIFFNEFAENLFGYSRDEIVGSVMLGTLLSEVGATGEVSRAYMNQLLNDPNSVTEFEAEVLTHGGRPLWIAWRNKPMYDADNQLSAILSVGTDISRHRELEKQLREQSSYLDSILRNSTGYAIATLNVDHEVTYFNTMAEGLFDRPAAEVIGRNIYDLHEAADVELHRLDQAFAVIRSQGEHQFQFDMKKGNDTRRICARSNGITDPDGHFVGYAFFARDITEDLRNEQARLAESRLDATVTMAGGIAHDFNNLMAGVLGYTDLLLGDLQHDPESTKMLQEISKCARRASGLTQQMLEFACAGNSQPRTSDLNKILDEVLRAHRKSIPAGTGLIQDCAADLWKSKLDPAQISQVILALITNAYESMPERGNIEISTQNVCLKEPDLKRHPGLKPGQYVRLVVRDTGSGMTPEVVSHAFEPFFSTKFQGRGMGLAAVHGIVRNHGGAVHLESQVGSGTRVEVLFPAFELDSEEVGRRLTSDELRGSETILVAEDSEIVSSVTQRMLQRLGYQVLVAWNGQEAIDLAEKYEGEIHLAWLDMEMPVLNGVKAFPRLRELRPAMKIILCSGYQKDATAQALLEAGAIYFVQKPVPQATLGREIRAALDRRSGLTAD